MAVEFVIYVGNRKMQVRQLRCGECVENGDYYFDGGRGEWCFAHSWMFGQKIGEGNTWKEREFVRPVVFS